MWSCFVTPICRFDSLNVQIHPFFDLQNNIVALLSVCVAEVCEVKYNIT